MLDMGFDKDIEHLQTKMPKAQSMIFSATVPAYIQEIAKTKMFEPLLIDLVGTQTNQIPDRIKNIALLASEDTERLSILKDFIQKNRDKKIMMFCETKKEAAQFEY